MWLGYFIELSQRIKFFPWNLYFIPWTEYPWKFQHDALWDTL